MARSRSRPLTDVIQTLPAGQQTGVGLIISIAKRTVNGDIDHGWIIGQSECDKRNG